MEHPDITREAIAIGIAQKILDKRGLSNQPKDCTFRLRRRGGQLEIVAKFPSRDGRKTFTVNTGNFSHQQVKMIEALAADYKL